MITLKCKGCGADIVVEGRVTSVTCSFCDRIYSVPMDEKTEQCLNLYSRADDAWHHKDFEEATELYQQILAIDNTQSEAHFGVVLCKYGITYEIDPVTMKKMPTCNRINRDSILDDKHYQSAIKYASEKDAASIRERAEAVDRISRDFLKIVDKEKPYDVFISYKRTADDGSVTADSKVARKLYYHLREKGFNVFFAEETLKNAAGEKYEPYIFAALSSAPVMVLVGSCRDHFEATWVKNEWRRYFALMNQGLKKTLIPAYFAMDPYNMPGELRNLQAMNMADLTFNEDITEIIRKKVADAREGQPSAEPQGMSLRDKYAPKEKVDKVVDITDCGREFAINVLVNCHGDIKETLQFIEEDPDYKKAVWSCVECGSHNTHDKCHKCGITKKESIEVARARKEMEERKRKQSKEYKAKKAETAKSILMPIVVLAVLGCLIAFVIWPFLIKPLTKTDDLNTPEIVQTYCYSSSRDTDLFLTVTECSADGKVTATLEFIWDGQYGKVDLAGQITKKLHNGKTTVEWSQQNPVTIPEGYTWTNIENAVFKNKFKKVKVDGETLVAGSDKNTIKSASDLQKLSGSSDAFFLRGDIDLAGTKWSPIEEFTGTLIGNGYTIKNMTIEGNSSNVGMFGTLQGTVINLKFENANVTVTGRNERVGILCGTLEGNISDITVQGTVAADKCEFVGGVFGYMEKDYSSGPVSVSGLTSNADVTGLSRVGGVVGCLYGDGTDVQMSDMHSTGTVTGEEDNVGGIAGRVVCADFDIVHVYDCDSSATVTGRYYVGGIVGSSATRGTSDSVVEDCTYSGAITAQAYVGCIAGMLDQVAVDSCYNDGAALTATGSYIKEDVRSAYVGGYVGYGCIVYNCTNEVAINYTGGGQFVGGIIGYAEVGAAERAVELKNVRNNKPVSGADYVGGIAGYCKIAYNDSVIESAENSGDVTASGNYAGGITGGVKADDWAALSIFDSTNTGTVRGNDHVGGITGHANANRGDIIVSGCSNQGSVNGSSNTGDIVGEATENVTVE